MRGSPTGFKHGRRPDQPASRHRSGGGGIGLVETKKEATHQAGLGPWTQLLNDAMRLQLLANLGRYHEVLAGVEALRPRMDALPLTGTQNEAATPWGVREVLLDTGHTAARQLGRWEQALSLNAEVVASTRARGASALEVARTRYNDYGPLIGLGRYGEAHALLMECREVFESEGYLQGLGTVFSALADLEDDLGHRQGGSLLKIPSLAKRAPTWEALRRSVSAILVTPVVRRKPIAAFRRAAMTSGPQPLRIRLASSPIVTSRM